MISKKIYGAATLLEAEQALEDFAQAWQASYPTIIKMWRAKWYFPLLLRSTGPPDSIRRRPSQAPRQSAEYHPAGMGRVVGIRRRGIPVRHRHSEIARLNVFKQHQGPTLDVVFVERKPMSSIVPSCLPEMT